MAPTHQYQRLQHLEAGLDSPDNEKKTPVGEARDEQKPRGFWGLPAPLRFLFFLTSGLALTMAFFGWITHSELGDLITMPCHKDNFEMAVPDVADKISSSNKQQEMVKFLEDIEPKYAAELHKRQDITTPSVSVPGDDPTTTAEPTEETTTEQEETSTAQESTVSSEPPPEPTTSDPPSSTIISTIEEPTSTVEEPTSTISSEPSSTSEPEPTEPETTEEPEPEPTRTGDDRTTSHITGTITSVLPDGRTTTLTSTSVVEVEPTSEATQDPSDPDLQNVGPRFAAGNLIALTVAMGVGAILVS